MKITRTPHLEYQHKLLTYHSLHYRVSERIAVKNISKKELLNYDGNNQDNWSWSIDC